MIRPSINVMLGVLLLCSIAATVYVSTQRPVHVTVNQPQPTAQAAASSHIDTANFQAVFLNNQQVYFGHLSLLKDGTYDLVDVYYLGSDGNSLVKLGSESHQPKDEMLIPASSVSFWENLQHANQYAGQLR